MDVSAPVAVESVHFIADSTSLFIGGATENLAVIVLPSMANQNVVYTLGDTAKVNLVNGAIKGMVEGTTTVVVSSVENPLKADTLKVTVRALQHVTGVSIAPHSLKLFIGGVTGSLSGSVLPATSTQKVQWQSMDTTIAKVDASGKVTAITAGATRIFARSQADSAKKDSVDITVKRDSPQVTVGHDTVVTVGTNLTFTPVVAPQEYGVVTQFKWDLDGNLVWDDSSTIVKSVSYKFDVEKEYVVRFYVRDTEGNETIVSQKVKATKGPTVNFITPISTGTYLTRSSTIDITGGSTTPQGPGAIKKVTYMLGTTVGTLSTNLATNGTGTWSIRGMPLVNNGTVDIKVIATDSFGISGQSMLSILMDSTAPSMPILLGTSPTASLPKWTWTAGGGGTGDFRFKLGDANFSGTEPTVKVLEYALASAITKTIYTLYVEERDVAGNWSLPASLSILYDLSKPTVSITKPQSSGTYLTRLGTVDLAGGTTSPQGTGNIKTLVYTIDGVAGTLATNLLSDGTWSIKAIPLVNNTTVAIRVTATDNLGNQGEATVSVSMDATAPASPVLVTPPVIVNSSDARTSLQWTWSRTGAASDSFIVKMNGVEISRQIGMSHTITTVVDGNYPLEVAEMDLAGNVSGYTVGATVLVDRTAPSVPKVLGTTPTAVLPKWTWTTGGGGSGDFRYKLGDATFAGTEPIVRVLEYTLSSAVSKVLYSLYVEERDAAGNWSLPSYLSISYDLTKPIVTIIKPQSSGTYLTQAGTVDVSGTSSTSPGSGPIKTITYTVNGVAGALATNLLGDGSWSIKAVPLTNNQTVNINVIATDNLGNQGEAAVSVSMDATAPNAPSITAAPPTIVNIQNAPSSLLWTWKGTGATTDLFVINVNGKEVARQSGTSYTISSPFADGTYKFDVSEIDLAGNPSSPTPNIVNVDRIAPSAPNLYQPKSPDTSATWNWDRGAGGTGTPQCKLGSGGTVTNCPSQNSYTLLKPVDGDYDLWVREIDAAGNFSDWATKTVTIDLVKPTLTLNNYQTVPKQITNTIKPFSVTASDLRLKNVQFQVGTGSFVAATDTKDGKWIFTPTTLTDGLTQAVTIRAEDSAGNQTSLSVQITYLSKVVFVRQGVTGGAQDGTSWADAFPELGPVLVTGATYPGKANIWVTEGTYVPASAEGFIFKSSISINGGFANEGTNRTLSERDLLINKSMLKNHPLGGAVFSNGWNSPTTGDHFESDFGLTDFTIVGGDAPININLGKKVVLTNIVCNNLHVIQVIHIAESSVDILNSEFFGNVTAEGPIMIISSNVRIRNTKISSNVSRDVGGGISFGSGNLCAGSSSIITGNENLVSSGTPEPLEVLMGWLGAAFSRESNVTIGPGGIVDPAGLSAGKITIVTSCPAPF